MQQQQQQQQQQQPTAVGNEPTQPPGPDLESDSMNKHTIIHLVRTEFDVSATQWYNDMYS